MFEEFQIAAEKAEKRERLNHILLAVAGITLALLIIMLMP